jgi:hypothetical protein
VSFLDALGAFLLGAVILAGVAIVVKPGSSAGTIIDSFGKATAGLITAAKS